MNLDVLSKKDLSLTETISESNSIIFNENQFQNTTTEMYLIKKNEQLHAKNKKYKINYINIKHKYELLEKKEYNQRLDINNLQLQNEKINKQNTLLNKLLIIFCITNLTYIIYFG
jgi:hypothetical protein